MTTYRVTFCAVGSTRKQYRFFAARSDAYMFLWSLEEGTIEQISTA